MIRIIIWFVLFAVGITLYAEFIISRPVNVFIEVLASAVMLLITIFFLKHLIRLLIKLLKL